MFFKHMLVLAALSLFSGPAFAAEVTCHENPTYGVVARERQDDLGTDFLVKAKPDASAKFECAYTPAAGDWRIENPDDGPYYFLVLKDRFLALDAGTGTNRSLIVYNLASREKILSVSYGADDFMGAENGFTFWLVTGEGNASNCDRFEEFSNANLGAQIETRATFDFASQAIQKTSQTRCTSVE